MQIVHRDLRDKFSSKESSREGNEATHDVADSSLDSDDLMQVKFSHFCVWNIQTISSSRSLIVKANGNIFSGDFQLCSLGAVPRRSP